LKPVWTLLRGDDKFGAWSDIESSLHEYWRQTGSQSLTPDRVTKFTQERNLDSTRSNRNRVVAIYKSILEKDDYAYDNPGWINLRIHTYLWTAIIQHAESRGLASGPVDGKYQLEFEALSWPLVSKIAQGIY